MTAVLGIVKDGKLVQEETWKKLILTLSTDFDSLETNNERSKRALSHLLTQAVKRRLGKRNAVLFSGGVDSSLIAYLIKKLKGEATCYTVGIEGSNDIAWAQRAASANGFSLRQKVLTLEELDIVVKNVIKITKSTDIVTVGVGSVLFAAEAMAKRENFPTIFSGLGSEELFAGYERHGKALEQGIEAVHKECILGLQAMWQRDLARDFSISANFGITLLTPFLDKDLMKEALSIHPMHKISKEEKKIILREVAEGLGLQKEFAWRKKQAAQYGSNFINGIEKIAKQKGFSLKRDYLDSLL